MVERGRSGTEEHYVESGRIGRAVGLKGEVAVFWNDHECPLEVGDTLFVRTQENSEVKPYTIAALRRQGRFDVLKFKEIEDRNAAQSLRGATLLRPVENLQELPAGQYYCYQILGMTVLTEEGDELGEVVRIFTAGENDVYEVLPRDAKKGDEILIPAINDVILSVDIAANRMIVRPMKGMLDDRDS